MWVWASDEELLAAVGDVAAGLVVNGKTLRCVVKVNEWKVLFAVEIKNKFGKAGTVCLSVSW